MESNSKSTGHKKKRDEESNKRKGKTDEVEYIDNSEEEENNDIIKTKDEIAVKLDDKKRITVRKFKGKLLVDIREFYNDNGEMKPGKKGIALSKENWNKLKDYMNIIDEAIENMQTINEYIIFN